MNFKTCIKNLQISWEVCRFAMFAMQNSAIINVQLSMCNYQCNYQCNHWDIGKSLPCSGCARKCLAGPEEVSKGCSGSTSNLVNLTTLKLAAKKDGTCMTWQGSTKLHNICKECRLFFVRFGSPLNCKTGFYVAVNWDRFLLGLVTSEFPPQGLSLL